VEGALTGMPRLLALAFCAGLICASSPRAASAQAVTAGARQDSPERAVLLGGDTLFFLKAGLGPFTPEQRAEVATERLQRLVGEQLADFDSAAVRDNGRSTDVTLGSTVLFTVTDEDADSAHTTRAALAAERARALTAAVEARQPKVIIRRALIGAGLTFLTSVGFLLFLMGLSRLHASTIRQVRSWRGTRVPALRAGRFEIFSSAQVADFLVAAVSLARRLTVLLLGVAYVALVLSFFPWTRGLTATLLDWVLQPLRLVGLAIVRFIPDLIFMLVIVGVTRLLLKLIHLVFNGIAAGRLELPKFPREWAEPTYKLVRLFVGVVALIVIFPYLPGSQSEAFKGVTVFVGLLLSLGSASATANLVAGVLLTYMQPFRVGDRVRIAETTGDVMEKTLLVTRIRTIKNEDITVPNAMVLASHIVNFSSSAAKLGLILSPAVTIAYDAPWRKVHQLLLAAAAATDGILEEPKPFILQTSLDDSYVRYELNAYTDRPNLMHLTYARLNENIQDVFNAAGVEIMSPRYAALRDGNKITIPESDAAADSRLTPFSDTMAHANGEAAPKAATLGV
jgi:small-conductance mechanosensitive channel